MNLLSARQTRDDEGAARDLEAVVSALYAGHAGGLTRLAYVMLGDRAAAEDVVHDAFAGLCRRWGHVADAGKAQAYLRSSVLNGCRSVLRRQARAPQLAALSPEALGADAPLLASEDRRAVLAALRRLPDRQREVLVLRYYLDLPDAEIARAMGIRESTVRSTAHRGLAAAERILTGESS
jgi:RNA polymerase sigma-70 factor (sigma-E family)